MRILFLSFPYLEFGGQGRMVRQMAMGFSERGHQMTLICIDSSSGTTFSFPGHQTTVFRGFLTFRERWRKSKLSHFFARARTFLSVLPAFLLTALMVILHTLVSFFRNDIFVGHGVYESVIISALHSLLGSRGSCIGVLHASILGYVSDRKRRLVVPFLKRLTHIVVLSGSERDVLCGLGIPDFKIKVIPYGFDLKSILAQSLEPIDSPIAEFVQDSPYFSCVARLCPQKDPANLVKAFAILHSRYPEFKLVMIGDGELEHDLLQLVTDLGLSGSVLLSGSKRNPFSVIRRSFAHVLASRYEGFGLVHAEALLLNVPVVASDVPTGPREILGGPPCSAGSYAEASYGILVPPESPVILAEALAHLVVNIVHFRFKATVGCKSVFDRYETGVMFKAWEPLLV